MGWESRTMRRVAVSCSVTRPLLLQLEGLLRSLVASMMKVTSVAAVFFGTEMRRYFSVLTVAASKTRGEALAARGAVPKAYSRRLAWPSKSGSNSCPALGSLRPPVAVQVCACQASKALA